MTTKQYIFPTIQKVLKQFGFKKSIARKELKEAIDLIFLTTTADEKTIINIVSKIRHATLVEEGIEE